MLVALCLALLAASPSLASTQKAKGAPSGAILRIVGDVGHPLTLRETDLLTMRRQTIAVADDKGERVQYEGVPVAELLKRAGVPLGKALRGTSLRLYVVAEAAEGYSVVFALAEFDADFTNRVILLADRRNSHALPSPEGPFRIIVPAEKRRARWVREVTTLDIQRAR